MKTVIREAAFAFLAWLVPLVASICLYPVKRSFSPLFDSLMGVLLVLNTAVLASLYLRTVTGRFLAAGMWIGILWTLANWALDGLMFSNGPMKMSFTQYAMGIGLGYLMIPVVTVALGSAIGRRVRA
jgi:hypothetical protein